MRRQLVRLKELAQHSHITIQILPLTFGAHLGLSGPFIILEFPWPDDDDLLFLENGRQAYTTRDDAAELVRYKKEFFRLESAATTEEEFVRRVDQALEDLP